MNNISEMPLTFKEIPFMREIFIREVAKQLLKMKIKHHKDYGVFVNGFPIIHPTEEAYRAYREFMNGDVDKRVEIIQRLIFLDHEVGDLFCVLHPPCDEQLDWLGMIKEILTEEKAQLANMLYEGDKNKRI